MSTSATRKHFNLLPTLAAALSLVSLSAVAQTPRSAPLGIYGGGSFGVGAAQWHCNDVCDRAVFSGKIFGGKRLTPGLAAEVNYMFFGGLDNGNNQAQTDASGISAVRQKFRAVTVGINWEVELLQDFTNHLRVGWAFTRRTQKVTDAAGGFSEVKDYGSAPYFGAGLSFRLTEEIRLVNGFDYVIDGRNSYYLFSVGASAEF